MHGEFYMGGVPWPGWQLGLLRVMGGWPGGGAKGGCPARGRGQGGAMEVGWPRLGP